MDTIDREANRVIDELGGTAEVARLCEVNMQAVSQWRRNGIPQARKQYLRVIRPDVFGESPGKPTAAGEGGDADLDKKAANA